MFTIVGGDQKQYGPVSEDDIRQWILQGRADGRTLALQQGASEWKPLSAFPEFAEALANAPRPFGAVPPRTLTPEVIVSRDYEVDILNCIGRGWTLVMQNLGIAIGTTLLVFLAQGAINQLIGLIFMPWIKTPGFNPEESFQTIWHEQFTPLRVGIMVVSGLLAAPFQAVFVAGLYRFYLKLIRGERAGIADAFSGFSNSLPDLMIVGFLVNLVTIIGTAFCVIPGIYLSIALIFSFPLVLDKGLSWSEAMKLSMKMVNKHWLVVFGLFLVAGLVGISGVIACCVGALFTLPVSLAALAYGYEEIFGSQNR